jgi:D-tyrosyl-tRNA(Tyr) deacylase
VSAPPEARRGWRAAAIAGAVAGAIAAGGAHYALKRFESANAPPIAVVDFGQVVADLPKDDSAPQTVNQRMTRVREAVKKLTDAGYLVLDGQAVLGAPEGTYVPAELVR